MIHYLPICIILALLGTLLGNPALYYELVRQRSNYKLAVKNSKKGEKVSKSDYSIFYKGKIPKSLVIGQFFAFIICFILSALVLYFSETVTVRWSTILAYLWIPAIFQIIILLIWLENSSTSFSADSEDCFILFTTSLIVIFFIIPIAIGIHKGVYNYLYPYDDITFMEEKYEAVPNVDELELLKIANLADGSSLKDPIYRNEYWIYPVANNSNHANSSGYLVVDPIREDITFINLDIVYSPWTTSCNNVDYIARKHLPSVVFFGNSTFQLEPDTGNVYFCKFYGDYACFRAGRKVEGAILIDATTGQCTCYSMDEIPKWVKGISF